MEIENLLYWV